LRDIAGVILAGGAGSRMGGDKALMPFGAGTLLDAVVARVAPQVSALAVSIAAGTAPAYRARLPAGMPLLFDAGPGGMGPLSGIVAGLEWLQTLREPQWLATFPCDTPFLPRDLVRQLAAHAVDRPVAARDRTGLQGVCALWPAACLQRLREGLISGDLRSLRSALDALDGTVCDIACEPEAFFNVNSRSDLATAEEIAARQA
jgi:molybdenum cofactor guanylyltransferase